MTPELAAAIRTEIAKLADRINDLTAERTALVKLLANGAEVPAVEAHEPPTIAFNTKPSRHGGRRKPGDITPTAQQIVRKIVADAGKSGIERQELFAEAGRKTNLKRSTIGVRLSMMLGDGELTEDDAGMIRLA